MGQVTVRYWRCRDPNDISPAFKDMHGPRPQTRQATAGVFDVAARKRSSVGAFDRRADIEIGAGARVFSR